MKVSTTGLAIKLTKKEEKLLEKIPGFLEYANDPDRWCDEWDKVGEAMEKLFASLMNRNGIPQLRLKILFEAGYAEKGKKSMKEEFESNGTKESEIVGHGHFVEYIDYFVNGPILPKKLIVGFCKLADGYFTQPEELRHFVRHSIREAGLTHYSVPTQIFRLSIERNLSVSTARTLRSEALNAIRKK